jgi:hypothetical protein
VKTTDASAQSRSYAFEGMNELFDTTTSIVVTQQHLQGEDVVDERAAGHRDGSYTS